MAFQKEIIHYHLLHTHTWRAATSDISFQVMLLKKNVKVHFKRMADDRFGPKDSPNVQQI